MQSLKPVKFMIVIINFGRTM